MFVLDPAAVGLVDFNKELVETKQREIEKVGKLLTDRR